jgi:hypothetical protein
VRNQTSLTAAGQEASQIAAAPADKGGDPLWYPYATPEKVTPSRAAEIGGVLRKFALGEVS